MSSQQKQLILSALKSSLAKNPLSKQVNQYHQSSSYANKPTFDKKPKFQKPKPSDYLYGKPQPKQDNLSKGVQLMMDNTALLFQNMAKLVSLNLQQELLKK